ncbi:ATP-NAD kinase family protein [Yaniella halotolerans]|uniref:ATP-NAD kinase family protein n=1 Tax=Yaniella halotolerans TaxID=225453 RepID=UPI0003B6F7C4|nr:ATP-NAD kinase family protein [Yaniella halotolerans]
MIAKLQAETHLRIGLVVNPVAGIGGTVGLKGSDGSDIQKQAVARGASPRAQHQATKMLRHFADIRKNTFEIITVSKEMGEFATNNANIEAEILEELSGFNALSHSTAQHTKEAVQSLDLRGVDLVVFAGGDGTARDVHAALEGNSSRLPVLGIPAGVKMQSGVFARSAEDAAVILNDWSLEPGKTVPAEIADIDEEAHRQGVLTSQLYGYLNVPDTRRRLQGGKVGSSIGTQSLPGLASECAKLIDSEAMCLLGPGSTVQGVSEHFGAETSLLGVDVLHRGEIIGYDLSAYELHQLTVNYRLQLIVSPIGGQGFLFGRGNQQLDSELLTRLGTNDLLIVCTEDKLAQLGGGPLYIDVPDAENIERFTGYQRVITGTKQTASILVKDARH